MRLRTWLAVAAAACVVSTSPISWAQQQERVLDEGYLGVWLGTDPGPEGTAGKYRFNVRTRVLGRGFVASDAVRVVWKQNGRTLATQFCPLEPSNDEGFATTTCTLRDATLEAVGPVQADLIFQDDQNDREVPLRTLSFTVERFYEWIGTFSGRAQFNTYYQIVDDGLLGHALLWREPPTLSSVGKVFIYFWGAQRENDSRGERASVRCSVNGQRVELPQANQGRVLHPEIAITGRHVTENRTEDVTYGWYRYRVSTGMIFRARPDQSGTPRDPRFNISEHPGNYMCELRLEGQTVREFRFTVGPDGRVPMHAEQLGEGALHFRPDMWLIDVRIPSPELWDFSVQPDAIRRASFFGRPWRHPEALAEQLRALPAAFGRSVPAAPASMRGAAAPAPAGRAKATKRRGRGRR